MVEGEAMRERLKEDDMIADGFDEAIIGVAEIFTGSGCSVRRVLYDRSKCIEILAATMPEEDSWLLSEEYFEFNVAGSYLGPRTPMFVDVRWAVDLHLPRC